MPNFDLNLSKLTPAEVTLFEALLNALVTLIKGGGTDAALAQLDSHIASANAELIRIGAKPISSTP